jgi:hypothetical protein
MLAYDARYMLYMLTICRTHRLPLGAALALSRNQAEERGSRMPYGQSPWGIDGALETSDSAPHFSRSGARRDRGAMSQGIGRQASRRNTAVLLVTCVSCIDVNPSHSAEEEGVCRRIDANGM